MSIDSMQSSKENLLKLIQLRRLASTSVISEENFHSAYNKAGQPETSHSNFHITLYREIFSSAPARRHETRQSKLPF